VTTKILLDCDPGIDDALAIALAAGSGAVELVALTTVAGNVPLAYTSRNARAVAEYIRLDVPVHAGAAGPLSRPLVVSTVHGASGLGAAVLPEPSRPLAAAPAAEAIVERVMAEPGAVTLVATGPLTNIAQALRREPRLVDAVTDFVIMGGSYTRGNVTPAAEFNISVDPEAAAIVFDAGWRVTMVGLDLTHQARADASVRRALGTLGTLSDTFLSPLLASYGGSTAGVGPAIHDACAIAYVIRPELFTCVPALVRVETRGEYTAGMTVTDFDAPAESHNALVPTTLDTAGFWSLMAASYGNLAARLRGA
jgi:purine nucleosidase